MSGTKASAMNAMTRRRSRAKRGAHPAEFLTYEKTRPLTRTVRLDDRSVARPRRARRRAEAFAKVTGSFRGGETDVQSLPFRVAPRRRRRDRPRGRARHFRRRADGERAPHARPR